MASVMLLPMTPTILSSVFLRDGHGADELGLIAVRLAGDRVDDLRSRPEDGEDLTHLDGVRVWHLQIDAVERLQVSALLERRADDAGVGQLGVGDHARDMDLRDARHRLEAERRGTTEGYVISARGLRCLGLLDRGGGEVRQLVARFRVMPPMVSSFSSLSVSATPSSLSLPSFAGATSPGAPPAFLEIFRRPPG